MQHTALIIDDEADIRELIALSLGRIGLDTHTAGNLEEARNLLDKYTFDVCLTDMKLPDGNGVDFIKHILSVQPHLPVALITAHGNMEAAVGAMKNGAFDFVSKPVDLSLLRTLTTQALKMANSANADQSPISVKQEATSHRTLPNSAANANTPTQSTNTLAESSSLKMDGSRRLIGNSEPMQALKLMISKVARTNAPIWITGESGTGKELIARLIHDNGPRADAPFIAINCGAIPSELMESEMFGHRRGSFTGAHSHHDGLFKRAEGGTLFFDEVAELPLHMQVKLLRTIQERKVRPVGSSDEINTNVRILSASHKDLAVLVDKGLFRHDLYYRLNVICIRSPGLRERCDDIVVIARHILHSIAESEGISRPAHLTPEAEKSLTAYSFPGNVRELENILERAVALSDTRQIEANDLNLQDNVTELSLQASLQHRNSETGHSNERTEILNTLAQTRWNRKAAAKQLGMTYRQLRYRIKQYGIDEDNASSDNRL